MAAKKQEVALKEDFDLQVLSPEIKEAIQEEMDGLGNLPFDRVKIPSGGNLAFELPGENEEETVSTTEIVGVILYHNPVNTYWKEKFTGGNEQPDCASIDGKKGIDRETGEIKDCASCPHNQFGSDGAGKACKNVHRLIILREGNPVPLVLSLPPTSIKAMRDYIAKSILLKGMRCYDAITRITLKKEKNSGGITYSRAVISFAGKLTEAQREAAASMAEIVKNFNQNVPIDADDYAVPQEEEDTGFHEVPDTGEALPFK